MSIKVDGKSGLHEIEVTPAVFLQLHDQLESGKKLPFNQNQLLIAFSRYLRDTKGSWTREEIKFTKDLYTFAEKYVEKNLEKLKKLEKRSSASSSSAPQRKAEKFLQQHGLVLADEKDLPLLAHADENAPASQRNKGLKRTLDGTELAMELMQIAKAADPGVAVAAVLITYTLFPNISSLAIDGTNLLIDKYERRTKTSQEKDNVLHGLEIITARLSPTQYNEPLTRIQEQELKDPHAANPHRIARLENLKGRPEDTNEFMSLFKGNEDMIVTGHKTLNDGASAIHNAIFKSDYAKLWGAPKGLSTDFSKGPKPPTAAILYDPPATDSDGK